MTESSAKSATVDLRCPVGAKKLLARIRQTNGPVRVTGDNLLELACRDCRVRVANETGSRPTLVVHRFNVLGELVESEVIRD